LRHGSRECTGGTRSRPRRAAVSLFVVFLGALRATLRRREGEAGALSATTVIAGSVLAAAALVAVAIDDSDLTMLLALPAATVLVAAVAAWVVLTSAAMIRSRGD
jgi:hypothetical protein